MPLDQIEDILFEEIVKLLNSDFKAIVRIIQIEKELTLRFINDEDEFYDNI